MSLVVKDQYKNTGYGTTFGGDTMGKIVEAGNDVISLTYGGVMTITPTEPEEGAGESA